eukprot:881905-Rhodomonas_salina.5
MAREEEAAESGKDEEERRGREEREGRGPPVKCRGCIHLVATKRMSVSDTAERMRGAMREMLPSNSSDQEGRPGPVSVWDIARLIRRKTGIGQRYHAKKEYSDLPATLSAQTPMRQGSESEVGRSCREEDEEEKRIKSQQHEKQPNSSGAEGRVGVQEGDKEGGTFPAQTVT